MLKLLPFFFFSVFIGGFYSLPAADFAKSDTIRMCQSCSDNEHDVPSDSSTSDDGLPCESEEVQEEEVEEASLLSDFNINYFRISNTNNFHFPKFVFFAPFLNICSPPPESLSFSLLRA